MTQPPDRTARLQAAVGFLAVSTGEALVLSRIQPASRFTFPLLWFGFILFLDAALYLQTGQSAFRSRPTWWLRLLPVSAVCWWIFEAFNLVVKNWLYVGGAAFSPVGFVVMASIDFSTVIPAVVTASLVMFTLLGQERSPWERRPVPGKARAIMLGLGLVCLGLPLLYPRYAFGLVWGCTFFLCDPVNDALGRPSIIGHVWNGRWRIPLALALATLMCGFFWESWNYWAMPKWKYNIPYVGFWHIFEMPLLGWLGYLPFGLEVFAMTNFLLPLLHAEPLDFAVPTRADEDETLEKSA